MEAIPQDIYYVKCQEVLLDDFQGYSLGAIPSNHCVWLMFTMQHPPEVLIFSLLPEGKKETQTGVLECSIMLSDVQTKSLCVYFILQ